MIISLLVNLLGIYFLIGFCFAIVFVFKGAPKIDTGATKISIWLRLMLIPGSTALWPLLLTKWVSK